MPKTTKDLDRPNTALSNFDQIISVIDAESEQEDTTIEPEEAQDDNIEWNTAYIQEKIVKYSNLLYFIFFIYEKSTHVIINIK